MQNKYFNSFFLVHALFGKIPIPLPGVYLLSVLLFINLTCGAIIRVTKDWRHPGMLIAHGGILYMLIAGFVIGGSTAKTLLVRAVGPTLSSFGVSGVLLVPGLWGTDRQLFLAGQTGGLHALLRDW